MNEADDYSSLACSEIAMILQKIVDIPTESDNLGEE